MIKRKIIRNIVSQGKAVLYVLLLLFPMAGWKLMNPKPTDLEMHIALIYQIIILYIMILMNAIRRDWILQITKAQGQMTQSQNQASLFKAFGGDQRNMSVPAAAAWSGLVCWLGLLGVCVLSLFPMVTTGAVIIAGVTLGLGSTCAGTVIGFVVRQIALGRAKHGGIRGVPFALRFAQDYEAHYRTIHSLLARKAQNLKIIATLPVILTFFSQTLRLMAPFIHMLILLGGIYYLQVSPTAQTDPQLRAVAELGGTALTVIGLTALLFDFKMLSGRRFPHLFYGFGSIWTPEILFLTLGLIIALFVKEPPAILLIGSSESHKIWYPSRPWDFLRLLWYAVLSVSIGAFGMSAAFREKRREPDPSSPTGYTFGASPSEWIFLLSFITVSFGAAEMYRFLYFLVRTLVF